MFLLRYTYIYTVFFLAVLFGSCGNSNSKSKCEAGDPVAIFSDKYEQIVNHSFKITGTESLEEIEFENGIKLELAQSGCESLKQEFRFIIPGYQNATEESLWSDFAINLFNYMGGIDIAFADFSFWSQAIKQAQPNLNVGVPFELGPGRWIKIDKISSSDHAVLIVTLSQQES